VQITAAQRLEREWLGQVPGVEGLTIDAEGTSAQFRARESRATLSRVLAGLDARGIDLVELHVSKATLEDVFLQLTAGVH
jgi:hypothetical protein